MGFIQLGNKHQGSGRRGEGGAKEELGHVGKEQWSEGFEIYMANRGMLALAEWQGSHEEEEPAEAEEGEFWDSVSGGAAEGRLGKPG